MNCNNHQVHEVLQQWRQKPLSPADYCQIWVAQKGFHPSDRGYRKACIAELHRVLGISPNTIKCWGQNFEKCQDAGTLLHLRSVHILNVERQLLPMLHQPLTGKQILNLLVQRLEALEPRPCESLVVVDSSLQPEWRICVA